MEQEEMERGNMFSYLKKKIASMRKKQSKKNVIQLNINIEKLVNQVIHHLTTDDITAKNPSSK